MKKITGAILFLSSVGIGVAYIVIESGWRFLFDLVGLLCLIIAAVVGLLMLTTNP